jgi:hypothetical protein
MDRCKEIKDTLMETFNYFDVAVSHVTHQDYFIIDVTHDGYLWTVRNVTGDYTMPEIIKSIRSAEKIGAWDDKFTL